ncbi:MAG TPA: DNA internalization-related competence protein ComEC/Rec2, partial [Thioploca sp.]|nr:DNA internalization-related competence protein ComEC/Rec2 [Thioploca sp.]
FYSLDNRKRKNLTQLENTALFIIKIQIIITLSLFPVLFFIFGYISLSSFIANLIAIPWVSFIVIPCTLLGIILSSLTTGLLHVAAFTFDAILLPMTWLANLDWNLWYLQPPLWAVIAAMLGIFILFLPSGFPARWLGFIWLLPLFTVQQFNSSTLKQGELWFTLLDVGQGLAVVIRTKNHTLMYDTGPNEYVSKTVIIPFLRAKKVQHIDKIIISHADKDHSGGFAALMNEIVQQDLTEILTSANYPQYKIKPCQAGKKWVWDGVKFQILHPPANFKTSNTNDKSCVLKITTKNNSILLPGDIGKNVELNLIANYGSELKTDILIAPHHGSRNSSTISFINTVKPKIVLFSTGYNNSYNHPRRNITQRYEKYKPLIINTAESGAINLRLGIDGVFKPSKTRKQRYWYK